MWSDLKDFVQRCVLAFELKREEGQAMVEYGLILGLVSVAAITALALIGTDISGVFTEVTNELGTVL